MMSKKIIISILFLMAYTSGYAMNLLRPYDAAVRPDFRLDKRFELAVFGEHGFRAKGFDFDGNSVNVLQLWNCDQDALKMLEGFDASTSMGQLAVNVRADGANDDWIRAHFCVDGKLTNNSFIALARYQFFPSCFLEIDVPFYSQQLSNVSWQQKTLHLIAGDLSVREKLTNELFYNVCLLGDGLYLGPWKRSGLGDITAFVWWVKDFWQPKPLLKKVQVNFRLGANFPTGLKEDVNKIFAQPFGFDGAFGLIFGFCLDLTLGHYLRLGGDVELTHRFGDSRCRRIKTNEDQTELLLLQKMNTYKNFGLIQRFNLYAQLEYCGWGLKADYQFLKRGDDIVALHGQCFSDVIANTARSLEESTLHQVIVKGSYDMTPYLGYDAKVKPVFALFTRIPFNGKRAAGFPTVGGLFSLDF